MTTSATPSICDNPQCELPAVTEVAWLRLCKKCCQQLRRACYHWRRSEETFIVYYVRDLGTGLIKIGSSATPVKRFQQLDRESEDGIEVLAIEPGNTATERARHRQFAELRIPGTEWFRAKRILAEYIEGVNSRHPSEFTRNEWRMRHPIGDEAVAAIRTAYAAGGVTHKDLAERYSVSRVQITRILGGQRR